MTARRRWRLLGRREFGAACAGLGLVLAIAVGWALRGAIAIEQVARSARVAVAAGRFEEAHALLGRWLAARPRAAEAHYLRARVALARGDLADVSESLRQAGALGFPTAQIGRLHAIVLSRLGRFAEAEPILVRALEEARAPDPEVEEALARVYLETYRLGQASTIIQRWMRDAPGDATPYLWLTEIDRRTFMDDTSNEEANYRAALERDPNLDQARLGLAGVLLTSHRTDEAAREYTRYLARKPDDPAGLIGAGRAALEQSDEEAAAGFLDRALAQAPANPAALRERAVIDLRHGELAVALARLNRAVAADPYDSETHHTRSLVLARLGRIDESKADQAKRDQLKDDQDRLLKLRDRLVDDLDNNDLRCEVAAWMFAHGRPEEGLRWANQVLAVSPTHRAANSLLANHFDHQGEAGLANFYRLRAGDGLP